ncbi:MAG: hypothetical protein QG608_1405, partial [Actinomycetota bacterium]|nr:hypothetical protein [Actinomycetota bacterium]
GRQLDPGRGFVPGRGPIACPVLPAGCPLPRRGESVGAGGNSTGRLDGPGQPGGFAGGLPQRRAPAPGASAQDRDPPQPSEAGRACSNAGDRSLLDAGRGRGSLPFWFRVGRGGDPLYGQSPLQPGLGRGAQVLTDRSGRAGAHHPDLVAQAGREQTFHHRRSAEIGRTDYEDPGHDDSLTDRMTTPGLHTLRTRSVALRDTPQRVAHRSPSSLEPPPSTLEQDIPTGPNNPVMKLSAIDLNS